MKIVFLAVGTNILFTSSKIGEHMLVKVVQECGYYKINQNRYQLEKHKFSDHIIKIENNHYCFLRSCVGTDTNIDQSLPIRYLYAHFLFKKIVDI